MFNYDDEWEAPTWREHLIGWALLLIYGIVVCTGTVAGFMWLVELWRKVL